MPAARDKTKPLGLTLIEIANQQDVSLNTVLRWQDTGRRGRDGDRHRLPYRLIDNRRRTTQNELDAWFGLLAYNAQAKARRERAS